MKKSKSFAKKLIGRIELVSFPEWKISDIEAKIDTGAYTSSLHCHHVETYQEDGIKMVRFFLLDPNHPEYEKISQRAQVKSIRNVKSSNGLVERRIAIKTMMEIAGKSYNIELTLADRSRMKYPVLLGRRFLQNRFIVDVSEKFLNNNHK